MRDEAKKWRITIHARNSNTRRNVLRNAGIKRRLQRRGPEQWCQELHRAAARVASPAVRVPTVLPSEREQI